LFEGDEQHVGERLEPCIEKQAMKDREKMFPVMTNVDRVLKSLQIGANEPALDFAYL
jgi:hypothetical protein